MNPQSILLFVPMIGLFVAGATLLRLYAHSDHWPTLGASLLSYGMGSYLMTRLMKGENFAVLMSVNNTTQLAIIVLIGVFLFNEPLTRLQLVGFALALIAVTLMAIPPRAS